jgi:hypothetical protein
MRLTQQITDSLANQGLDIERCLNDKDLLKLVGIRKPGDGSILPFVYLKNSDTTIARVDDFFISVLLAKAQSKDLPNFNEFFKVSAAAVSMMTSNELQLSLPQNNLWLENTHPAQKLAHIYYYLANQDPFFYSKKQSEFMVEMVSEYTSVLPPNQINKVFEEALKLNALEIAFPLMQYNVTSNDADVCRSFFTNLLRSMPSHYYLERKDEIIDIARRLVASHDLGKMPLDVRNPKVTVYDYVLRSSTEEKNPAQACVHLFNESSFTSLFDQMSQLSEESELQPSANQSILY